MRYSTEPRTLSAVELAARAAEGRRPSYDSSGHIRGFRSRPGAPTAQPLEFGMANVSGATNATPMDAWNRFFHKTPTPATPPPAAPAPFITPPPSNLAPVVPPDTTGMDSTTPRPYTTPQVSADAIYGQAAQGHADYLGIPGASRVGNTITSQYGTGSVRTLPPPPSAEDAASLSLFDPEAYG